MYFAFHALFRTQDGKVTQNYGPDPFEVSDASTMVNYLKSAANKK
jgi:hypothetical protein